MKILVVGSGGREHALVWRLARAGHALIAAPGNPGIARLAECDPVEPVDVDGIVGAATARAVDLVVVGPEAPLVAGLADRLRAAGIAVFGPSAAAARLEGSKVFAKRFFARHGIRSAEFAVCESLAEVDSALADLGGDVVVKADGLAAGKGVVVCASADAARAAARAMLEDGRFGDAGRTLVIERRLRGHELSVMAITDGDRAEILAQAEDHKAIFDGDAGPNTGGMGAVSPAAWATSDLVERIRREVFEPTLRGLRADGLDYRGVLYAGLMVDDAGAPWLLEYNCRFGDPETQAVMMRLENDLADYLAGAAAGRLPAAVPAWDPRTAVCVIVAAEGYPAAPVKGDVIEGAAAAAARPQVALFHAGTASDGGELVTAGGRIFGVTALGDGVADARERAYAAVGDIRFRGMHYRRDIGARHTRHTKEAS